MSPAFIQARAFISKDGLGQGRMVGNSTGVYKFDSVTRGHHVYKTVDSTHWWNGASDAGSRLSQCEHHEYAVAITKGGQLHCCHGHMPREIIVNNDQVYAHFYY